MTQIDLTPPRPEYRSFLLRLWRDSPNQPWRMTLIDIANREHKGFDHLQDVYTFLQEQVDGQPPTESKLS